MYKTKYIKYKTKYIALKNKLDNASNTIQDGGNWFKRLFGSTELVMVEPIEMEPIEMEHIEMEPIEMDHIVMDPIVLYKNNSDEYCSKIKTLMSENKTFVRVPGEGLDNFNENSTPNIELIASVVNPDGVKCTFASLLIPGWYETYGTKVAGLFCNYKDDKFIDVDKLGKECNLKNYIWPSDAYGTILNGKVSIHIYDAIMGMAMQAISFKDFIIYIYKNNLLTDEEKINFKIFYDKRLSLRWSTLLEFLKDDKQKLNQLITNCFKTYSDFVLFVKNVKREPNVFCGKEGYKTKDYQKFCMNRCYTETLLPEHKKLVGLYVPSIYKCETIEKYNELKELAIKKAIELNIPVFSLEERM